MLLAFVYSLLRLLLDVLLVRGHSEAGLQSEVLLASSSRPAWASFLAKNPGWGYRRREELGEPIGEVVCHSRLGGLLNECSRRAA